MASSGVLVLVNAHEIPIIFSLYRFTPIAKSFAIGVNSLQSSVWFSILSRFCNGVQGTSVWKIRNWHFAGSSSTSRRSVEIQTASRCSVKVLAHRVSAFTRCRLPGVAQRSLGPSTRAGLQTLSGASCTRQTPGSAPQTSLRLSTVTRRWTPTSCLHVFDNWMRSLSETTNGSNRSSG